MRHFVSNFLNEIVPFFRQAFIYLAIHRVPEKQATLIFDITSPSVEIFLQFLKHFVQE